jgi:UDP-GlcNAc:undecaprenyl-phosphate/decaprenyl-phosphate GlcNAc-1-phosphate transferase
MQGIAAYLIAFLATGTLIHVLVPLSSRIGLVDRPRGHKAHQGRVPLVGGIAMFCGFLFAILAPATSLNELRPLFAGSALLVIVGVLDDFHELNPHSRFVAQIAAALLMSLWGGVALTDLGSLLGTEPLLLGPLSVPFTLFCTVGVINAFNMQDGMDGLAGGLALIAFSLLGLVSWQAGLTVSALALLTLSAAVAAFLLFNMRLGGRRQAIVFMGNSGSLFLGFALAWFLVRLSQGDTAPIDPVTALWIVALPLMDTVGIMLRRGLRGRSPLLPDREHLHHLLCRLGLGVNQALALALAVSAALAALGMTAQALEIAELYRFAAFLGLFAVYYTLVELLWMRLNRTGQHIAST